MEFSQVAIFLITASILGIAAKILRQPLFIGYLLGGILLASLGMISDLAVMKSWGEVGVALLLFLLGIEMNLGELPTVGKTALIVGFGQMAGTFLVSFILVSLFGISTTSALYISLALTFSSTIITVKLLSEKKDLESLYGRISVGILLIQDFAAISALMFLSGMKEGTASLGSLGLIFIRSVLVFCAVWISSRKLLPFLFEKVISRNTELLFIVSISWALGIAAFVAGPVGLSIEIGGFLAGISLSNLTEHLQVATRIKPLRDFFLTIFFLVLGAQFGQGKEALPIIPLAFILSLVLIFAKPLLVTAVMGFLGYKKRTSFLTGLTLAQISEFSLILMAMGESLGHVAKGEFTLVVWIGVFTMTTSTYLIVESERIYNFFKKYLSIFERVKTKESAFLVKTNLANHIVLVGCDRTGSEVAAYLNRKGLPFVVVDFSPKVFTRVSAQNIPVVFGDINDEEILSASNIDSSRLIISTISNINDNLAILEYLKNRGLEKKITSIFTAVTSRDGLKLYEKGASYVVVPEVVAGDYVKHLLRSYGANLQRLSKSGKKHFDRLIFK